MPHALAVPRRRLSAAMRRHRAGGQRARRHRPGPDRLLCHRRRAARRSGRLITRRRRRRSPSRRRCTARTRRTVVHVPEAGSAAAAARREGDRDGSTGDIALQADANPHGAASADDRPALPGNRRRDRRRRGPARFRHSRRGLDKEAIAAELAARIGAQRRRHRALDHRRGTLANPGLVKTMSVKPPMGQRPRSACRHRGAGPPAVRRHPCAQHRRDRPGRRHQHREEGQDQPSRPHRAGLIRREQAGESRPQPEETHVHQLVSTHGLHDHLSAPDVVVVDASWYLPAQNRNAQAEYAEGHIPGAVYFDIDEIADTSSGLPHMMPSAGGIRPP